LLILHGSAETETLGQKRFSCKNDV